jgi:MoaA/NifB/PqqE/SkfB family radical SAM enzyme
MERTVPQCVAIGDADDVSLNCCITAWNYRDVPDIVRLAARWGVSINFSVYTPLRMDDPKGLVKHHESASAAELKEKIAEVIALKQEGYPVFTSERVLWKFYDFLLAGRAAGCQAGYRFLVINPDGRLTPCAMVMAYFNDHRTMQREFSRTNTCEACFISTRAHAEKTLQESLADNVDTLRLFLPWNWARRAPVGPRRALDAPTPETSQ